MRPVTEECTDGTNTANALPRVAAALLAVLSTLTAVLVIAGSTGAAEATAPARSLLAAPTVSALDLSADSASPTGQQTDSRSSSSPVASSSSPTGSISQSPTSGAVSTPSADSGESTPSASPTAPSSAAPSTTESSTAAPITSVGATVAPATPPAAVQSEISRGTVLIALGVLLIAVAVLTLVVVGTRRRRRSGTAVPVNGTTPTPTTQTAATQTPTTQTPTTQAPVAAPGSDRPTVAAGGWSSPIDGSSLGELMALLVDLGDTMVDSGDPVTHVRDCLVRVARANGVSGAEVIVLPTALIITLPGMQDSRTEVASTGESKLRLDQVEAVFTVADAAVRGDIGPRTALIDLRAARTLPPSFGPAVIVAGHAVIAVGLAVILAGGWTDIGVAAVLGAAVGGIKQWAAQRRLAIQVFLPVSCAFLVGATVALLGRTELDLSVLPPILGALVTFIPGGLLTTAVIELATAQMISGASRFVYGSLQLVLLSLGIVGGLQLVGIPAITVAASNGTLIAAIAPWIGVFVFGVGVLLSYSGRPGALGWMLLVLYVAYAGQVIGGVLFGSSLSAFVGAAVMTPVAGFVATQRTGPPTLITFLPAFWLLVPGAIALVGVTQVMSDARVDGVSAILGAGITIVSIALGVVLGLSVGDWVNRIFRR